MRINENWQKEYNSEALKRAFDELARKDGFDSSTAFYDTPNVALNNTDENGDESIQLSFDEIDHETDDDYDEYLDDDAMYEDDDEDIINFGDGEESMEDRIKAARSDITQSKVSVPKDLDSFATSASQEFRRLGFRREVNPFGMDETPRAIYSILQNSLQCSACGADFQDSNEHKPGFLPPSKFEVQKKLKQIEDAQNKMLASEWTPEDEVEWLLSNGGDGLQQNTSELGLDAPSLADQIGLDLDELSRQGKKKVICKRCHGLQNFGTVEEKLRPGWSDEPLLSQESFRNLLKPIKDKNTVIVALVDVFDFSGSVLPELDSIAGRNNPVILAANKADLLPTKMGQQRVENWVRRELEYLGINCLANVGGAVRLVSCKTGFGLTSLLEKARELANERDGDIYLVGAANAGKSTLINRIMEAQNEKIGESKKRRAGNQNAFKGAVTTSPLPGTTLKFIKVAIGDGINLYDTPGLLVPGTITQSLTPEELKMVVPKREVEPITFRVPSGKCVCIGGLAKVEVIDDSRPFLLTFFVSNDIKLHVTDSVKADEFIANHVGGMLTPPLSLETLERLGGFESHTVKVEGFGWKEAAADITLRGLGWVAVTGPGTASIRISVPKGTGISVRPPLMPFDALETAAKYTGGRATRKSSRSKSGKRRGGVGRR